MRHFNKKNREKSLSLSAITWKKLKKRKLGMFSLSFLLILTIVSVAGYLITPDHTPFCNDQILEIRLLKPGSKVTFLKVKKNKEVEQHSLWHKMLFGQENPYLLVPINSYSIKGDTVIVNQYQNCDTSQTGLFQISDLYSEKSFIVNKKFLLGTDKYGRDLLSQIIIGARVSLSIGFISICIALIIGIFLGACSGYFGGKTDDLISWFINVVWSVPTLLLVIAISFVLGTGFWQVFIAIGLTMWVDIARVVRGQFVSYKEKDYVESAKSMGFRNFTIIFKHILPNINGTLMVITASNFASAILMEAGLSFLGIGVQSPMPSWGKMIKENYGYLILDYAYLAIIPGIAIVLLVLAFMLIGNTLRDVMDVKDL